MYNSILISSGTNISEVVLSLPLIDNIYNNIPNALIYFLVKKEFVDLVADNPNLEGVLIYDKTNGSLQSYKAQSLIKRIKNLNIDNALVLYNNKEILSYLQKAGIKNIYGNFNNFIDLINYKKGLWQYRDKAKKHELEYNLDLLKLLGIETNKINYELKLLVSNEKLIKLEELLKKHNINDKYIVINPLSANEPCFNWRYSYYSELASRLINKFKIPVLFIGEKEDDYIISVIYKHTVGQAFNFVDKLDLGVLIALISKASLFISPKSSFMHIAVAVDTPVLSFFNSNRILSNKRWGPYNTNYTRIIIPNCDCPGTSKCLKSRCKNFYCMDTITIEEVFEKASKIINKTESDQMSLDFRGKFSELR